MNFKAWDNNEATYGLPSRLLLVLKVCGRLRVGMTGVFGALPQALLLCVGFVLRSGLLRSGMKEGCSGENVLERER